MSVYPTTSTNNVSLSHDFYKFHGVVQWHCRRVDTGRPMIHMSKSTSLSAVGGTFQANHFVHIVMRTSAGNLKKRKKEKKDIDSNKTNNTCINHSRRQYKTWNYVQSQL